MSKALSAKVGHSVRECNRVLQFILGGANVDAMALKHHRDAVMQRVYLKRGLAMEIAAELGISYQAVQRWKRVPPEHVLTLAPILKMKPEEIRPDVFNPRKRGGPA